ncbi:hypothetical protein CCR85_11155 [Rhodothalassium salexigens]|uniref:regulatory protein RecX n=1 Tax=Rhodothalassium salexigens TaxID=1086 RepID=UPI0019124311|nr:RecX family transcriptional regulator [Rhodothalassium salexigens]MBK5912046.1 hypothetical protein [Rhodothalassium salexigens]MBK5921196.1 hypothetical protein [Rhodothalassium salexigens]
MGSDPIETEADVKALLDAAFRYLGRFAATRARLVAVLARKADAAGLSDEAAETAVARVVARCEALSLIDDAAYAEMRARTLAGRGKGARAIAADLRSRGVAPGDVEAGLAALRADAGGDRAADLKAAATLARRKRLGPFSPSRTDHASSAGRPRADTQADGRAEARALGAFARAGVSYGAARAILDAADAEAVDALIDEAAELDGPTVVPDDADPR